MGDGEKGKVKFPSGEGDNRFLKSGKTCAFRFPGDSDTGFGDYHVQRLLIVGKQRAVSLIPELPPADEDGNYTLRFREVEAIKVGNFPR